MPVPVVTAYITAPAIEEARALARGLVEARLIACANILDNVTSVYRWNNEIEEAREIVILVKTTEPRLQEVITYIERHHSYDCPCVTSWTVLKGSPAYLDWVRAEVAG